MAICLPMPVQRACEEGYVTYFPAGSNEAQTVPLDVFMHPSAAGRIETAHIGAEQVRSVQPALAA